MKSLNIQLNMVWGFRIGNDVDGHQAPSQTPLKDGPQRFTRSLGPFAFPVMVPVACWDVLPHHWVLSQRHRGQSLERDKWRQDTVTIVKD